MCSRASGLFCACLFVSYVVHSCRCAARHGNHEHHIEDGIIPEKKADGQFFVQELFIKYGHNGILTIKQFEQMLESSGLSPVIVNFHNRLLHHQCNHSKVNDSQNATLVNVENLNGSETVQKSDSETVKMQANTTPGAEQTNSADSVNSGSETNVESTDFILNLTTASNLNHSEGSTVALSGNKCLGISEMLHTHNISSREDFVTQTEFFRFCPTIIYQIDHSMCTEPSSHNIDQHSMHDDSTYQVWIYASLSVLIISLCGLLSVAIIPIIQRLCYQMLLQFLVGLAVGSLSGDALLHLLPHSMVLNEEHTHHPDEKNSSNEESIIIWRGLTALLGIYLFFIAERLLNNITSHRRMKQSAKVIQVPKFARALTRVDGEQSRVVGEKLSHHKHGSYGYKFDPAAMESLEGLNETVQEEKNSTAVSDKLIVECTESQKDSIPIDTDISQVNAPDFGDDTFPKLDDKCESQHMEKPSDPSSPVKPLHVDVTYLPSDKQPEPETPTEECHRETVVYRHAHDDHSYVVTVTDHHHGHSHEVPNTISAVAWMVVMGDGLHNFCDGLAIGAAFGAGISGGISTAVAVLCHELPHELGDFAMLLKAGMTVKQALLYNSLSSFLCFVGMLIGVSLGNFATATSWIFAGAAGMFLYIALVDMLPELAAISGHPSASGCKQLLLQFSGMAIGTSIMLVIAMYEHDLQILIS